MHLNIVSKSWQSWLEISARSQWTRSVKKVVLLFGLDEVKLCFQDFVASFGIVDSDRLWFEFSAQSQWTRSSEKWKVCCCASME